MEVVVERLQGHNIKPSVQRIAIMKYLMEHRTHPTVDEIYTALSPTIPTLSKTTVYNTLKILSEQGAAQTLTIDERNTCYDADTEALEEINKQLWLNCTTCSSELLGFFKSL